MKSYYATTRSLSKTESRLVLDLEWRGQKTLSIPEMRKLLGGSEGYARMLAHRLVKKGWLERLRPGLFQLIPADRGLEGVPDQNPLAAGAVLVHPYFYSYATACTHHGLTEQVYATVYIACRLQKRPVTIRSTRYEFVPMSEGRFFGFADASVLGEQVKMAVRERALLDALDRPRHAGGLAEVSRMVARSGAKLDWQVLLELASRFQESALVQRLGYLLDLHQVEVPSAARARLVGLVRPGVKIHFGPRRRFGTSGTLGPWNVIENISRDVLIDKGEGKRTRIRFPKKDTPGDRG